ncbi:hypothetical protein BKA69DRAFT_1081031, partial [Paraphysoderma sedebokerense]
MYNMLLGIKLSTIQCSDELDRDLTDEDFQFINEVQSNENGDEFKLYDIAPLAFRELRQQCGVSNENFLSSISDQYILSELSSPGKSGSFLYFSHDYRFVFKTINKSEYKLMRKILSNYFRHMLDNPNTLITRFFGLYQVQILGKKPMPFVVMTNIFPPNKDIHEIYDLKGSTVRRYVTPERAAKSKVPVLKDLNFTERGKHLLVGPEQRNVLLKQLEADVEFLARMKLMDYSFLVGIHDMKRSNVDKIRETMLSVIERKQAEQDAKKKFASAVNRVMTNFKPKSLGEANKQLSGDHLPERQGSIFHSTDGGFQATDDADEPMNELYFFGIVDLFTEYTWLRKIERMCKVVRNCGNAAGISNYPPQLYSQRMLNFIDQVSVC